jgi:uncharacterized repeat protein (TIGR03803 family)
VEYNGKLYGMTREGGTNSAGVLYEYNLATSTYTVVHHFAFDTGYFPEGGLIEVGGKLYGVTRYGGMGSQGVLFRFDPGGGRAYALKLPHKSRAFRSKKIGNGKIGCFAQTT